MHMPAVGTEKVGPTMSRVPKFGANDDECGDPNQEYIMEPHAAQPILLEHDESFTCFLIVQRQGRPHQEIQESQAMSYNPR